MHQDDFCVDYQQSAEREGLEPFSISFRNQYYKKV
jgi:hypothetical protein